MKEKHSLDRVRVERRAIPLSRSIVIEIPFPPATKEPDSAALAQWREDAYEAISDKRVGCAPGAVDISVTLEDRGGFRAIGNLTENIIDFLYKRQIIAGTHAAIVRRFSLQWAKGQHGARVEISSMEARAA